MAKPQDIISSTLELYDEAGGTGAFLVYDNPSTGAHEEAYFPTRAQAEEAFEKMHLLLSSIATTTVWERGREAANA